MECKSFLFVKNHLPHLWGPSNSFSNSFIDFYSSEVASSSGKRKTEILSFYGFGSINWHNCRCFDTLNLFFVSSCEMFTFCDILHEKIRTNNVKKLSRMRNTHWKLYLKTGKSWRWRGLLQVIFSQVSLLLFCSR